MHEMTATNLRSAFGGESMAHMRYKVWAERAAQEKYPHVARLFRAISRAEQAHASGHFRAMGKVAGDFAVTAGGGFGYGRTAENLQGALDGELFEVNEMYPAYLEVAKAQREKAAERSMTYAIAAEKIHAAMYQKAKKAVDAGNDVTFGDIYICPLCGHTVENNRPETCPICRTAGKNYEAFPA